MMASVAFCLLSAPTLPRHTNLYGKQPSSSLGPRVLNGHPLRMAAAAKATNPSASGPEEKPAASPPAPEKSCFGKGARFPRRAVGLYELERVGINPYRVFDDGNKQNDAAFAAVVGVFGLACLGIPLLAPGTPIEGPVSAVAGALLTFWAVDALAFDSSFASVASAALQPRRRVAAHEAGHFLCAYLSGLPVTGYAMPRPVAAAAAHLVGSGKSSSGSSSSLGGREQPTGVQVDLSSADVYDIAAVGMGGVAAECCIFGISEGGSADLKTVCKAVRNAPSRGNLPATQDAAMKVARWGLLQAAVHLKDQAAAHKALSQALSDNMPLEDCKRIVEENFDWSKVDAAL
jgi:hypothetical protein